MFESTDESFDDVSELVPLAIMSADAMSTPRWNHGLSADGADLVSQRVAVVSLIANHKLGLELFQQDFATGHVVPLPFRQMELGRLALVIDRYMDFGAEAATGESQRLGVLPPFAPAACWWARTIVESSNRFDNSASPPSASSTRPQTPLLHQR